MYVHEEDIFSAIYYQLKLYIQEHFISSLEYDEQMAQLKEKFDAQVEFRHAIDENPSMVYEQYTLGEISLDEFKVKQQNLLWWPAPYDYGNILQDVFSPIEILEDFYGDQKWHQNIRMRSPIRIDFDSTNNKREHPHSHMHIENEETRINTVSPICFNRFIDFIFKNFYPQFKVPFSQLDFINYKVPDLETMNYLFSQVTI